MTLIVCAPKPIQTRKWVVFCPACKKRRRVTVNVYEWYDPSATCTAPRRRWKNVVKPCGYHWNFG